MNIVQKMIAGSVMNGMVYHYMKKLPKDINIKKEKELIQEKKSQLTKSQRDAVLIVSGLLAGEEREREE
jgi:hypothetical protein